jgi:hypothetical protein
MTFFYDLNKRLADISAKSDAKTLSEGAKPDFLDMDKDGNRKESFKQAVKDREKKMSEGGYSPVSMDGDAACEQTEPTASKPPKKTPFTYTIAGSDKVYGGDNDKDPLGSGELDKASTPWPKESTGDYSAKKARAGKDIGKPGKAFAKIAADAGKRYGSKAAGERVAGAVLNKLRKGVKEEGADLRDLSQFPTTPGGAAMGNPSIANQAAKARDMKEDSAPTEKVSDVIKRVMGDMLIFKPGVSKLYKDTRRSRTQRVDDYKMKMIGVDDPTVEKGNGYFSARHGHPLAKKLKRALIQAGYPVHDDLLIFPDGIMFQVRTPITTTSEAEMDEGNDFTGARLAAIKAGKNTFTVGGKNYRVTGDTSDEKMSEGRIDDLMDKRREAGKMRQAEKPRARFVAGKAYGGSAQRDEPEDDDEVSTGQSAEPKKRGRPAGTGRKIGAKGPTRRSKLAYGESADDITDQGEYDQEGAMAKDDIHTIVRNARELEKILGDNDNLPEWVQSKLAKIQGMMNSVSEYMQTRYERDDEEFMAQGKVEEESTDTRDTRAEKAGRKVTKDIEYDEKKKDGIHGKKRGSEDSKAEKAGRKVAKDIEYDEKKGKVKEESSAAPKASKGGISYGKGIYDSLNRDLEKMINEGMNITVNMSTNENGEPHKSVTVNADGDDAEKLADILKLAGLHGESGDECGVCGASPCGCAEVVDENQPNWPTNSETSDNALQYSGGINGPKSTGQTTGAPINDQPSRQGAMESKDLGMRLYKELQKYKN